MTYNFISAVGADWGAVDSGPSLNSDDATYYLHAHKKLLSNNKIILEYVKNIELLPPTGYTIYINPLPIYDSCGAPARVIAIRNPPSSAHQHCVTWMVGIIALSSSLLSRVA